MAGDLRRPPPHRGRPRTPCERLAANATAPLDARVRPRTSFDLGPEAGPDSLSVMRAETVCTPWDRARPSGVHRYRIVPVLLQPPPATTVHDSGKAGQGARPAPPFMASLRTT